MTRYDADSPEANIEINIDEKNPPVEKNPIEFFTVGDNEEMTPESYSQTVLEQVDDERNQGVVDQRMLACGSNTTRSATD